jgi:dienelactone hydrolase
MFRARWWAAALSMLVITASCAATHPARPAALRSQEPSRAPTSTVPASTTSTTIDLTPPTHVGALTISTESAPAMFVARAQWLRITHPDGAVQYAAVYRPRAAGTYPAVVYLHGSTGLENLELDWAARLAARGFVVVAGCYLNAPPTNRFVACPSLPSGEPANPVAITPAYDALLSVAAALPGSRPGPLGVVGVSYGAIAALSVAEPRVAAIVADSGYGKNGVQPIHTPVLMLGWTTDFHVAHANVVAFTTALRAAHKPVGARYYQGTGHVATLAPPPVGSDATDRAVRFLTQILH